jgi:predicted DCC family thiol-disulfide oxidoreductase YuxK
VNSKPIILFDGICNLCDGAVQFVIKHDPEKKFLFASLQSEAGQRLLKQYKLSVENFNSFILIKDEKVYSKSTGALKVARQIKGVWSLLYIFIIIPAFIRDTVYTWIAKNRYKWFGKKETCMMVTPEFSARFL